MSNPKTYGTKEYINTEKLSFILVIIPEALRMAFNKKDDDKNNAATIPKIIKYLSKRFSNAG